jgi:transcriptional regulator with XRE-family HTH domain
MPNKIDKISVLGGKILQAIEKQRLKKKDIYDGLGISRGTLDNWISGATSPSHEELLKMSNILNIDLLSGETTILRDEHVTMDMWQLLKKNNEKFQQEIDRLWTELNTKNGLIDRLMPPR